MTDETVDLDRHRGMAAQKATNLRRLLSDVEAQEAALRLRQDELERHLLASFGEQERQQKFRASLSAAKPVLLKIIIRA